MIRNLKCIAVGSIILSVSLGVVGGIILGIKAYPEITVSMILLSGFLLLSWFFGNVFYDSK